MTQHGVKRFTVCGGCQEITEHKNVGIDIFRYKINFEHAQNEDVTGDLDKPTESTKDIFIVINTKENATKGYPQKEKDVIPCKKCQYISSLQEKLAYQSHDGNRENIASICDHCRTKKHSQEMRALCEEIITKHFIGDRADRKKRIDTQLKKTLIKRLETDKRKPEEQRPYPSIHPSEESLLISSFIHLTDDHPPQNKYLFPKEKKDGEREGKYTDKSKSYEDEARASKTTDKTEMGKSGTVSSKADREKDLKQLDRAGKHGEVSSRVEKGKDSKATSVRSEKGKDKVEGAGKETDNKQLHDKGGKERSGGTSSKSEKGKSGDLSSKSEKGKSGEAASKAEKGKSGEIISKAEKGKSGEMSSKLEKGKTGEMSSKVDKDDKLQSKAEKGKDSTATSGQKSDEGGRRGKDDKLLPDKSEKGKGDKGTGKGEKERDSKLTGLAEKKRLSSIAETRKSKEKEKEKKRGKKDKEIDPNLLEEMKMKAKMGKDEINKRKSLDNSKDGEPHSKKGHTHNAKKDKKQTLKSKEYSLFSQSRPTHPAVVGSLPQLPISSDEVSADLHKKMDSKGNLIQKVVGDVIKGNKIIHISKPVTIQDGHQMKPLLFAMHHKEFPDVELPDVTEDFIIDHHARKKPVILGNGKGLKYTLSDRSFIEKGWTVLPTEKVLRKVNTFKMHPSQPESNWFKRNKHKGVMFYNTGEKLAEIEPNGCGKWFYRNGNLALHFYKAEEPNISQRYVLYSSGEPDSKGRTYPICILGMFDHHGNGVVFDHQGKVRLKYNQTEGQLLDRDMGPESHWKWHSLNDPPVLQQIMIETKYQDPEIHKIGLNLPDHRQKPDADQDLIVKEFENFVKEKSNKSAETFKPFKIKMKALRINEQFSIKILDQKTIYLIFQDGVHHMKLQLGMILDNREIVGSEIVDITDTMSTEYHFSATTESVENLRFTLENTIRKERLRKQYQERNCCLQPVCSADRLIAPLSKPLRPPVSDIPVITTYPSEPGNL